ncbi:MAG: ABC transporter ATP-binding protein [Defluviitaleaceae bacterium]|nr:ABC transporter ATP-binding protein [Defluviitaleaceae bacterium]
MIALKNITRTYKVGQHKRCVLNDLTLEIKKHESIVIEGRSGSGKTTLLNILIGLDTAFTGHYQFEEMDMSHAKSAIRAKFRQEKLGIITQHFDLLDDRNVYENIVLAIHHQKLSAVEKRKRISELLDYVNLSGYEKMPVKRLSGGEMQRVGIARALAKRPKLIVADEPTGSLDEQTRDEVLTVFKKMMQDKVQFIIVTHDKEVSAICNKVYRLQEGKLKNLSS